MTILDELGAAQAALEAAIGGLDEDCLAGADAVAVFDRFARCEQLAAAGRTLVSRRAAESGQWRAAGERSPAHWLARRTGTSISSAEANLESAKRLGDLGDVDAAVRAGRLSEAQTREITAAAAVAPDRQADLLEVAASDGWQGLRAACRRVAASAMGEDAESRHRAIHRGRYAKTWTDPDGAARLDLRTTPEQLAELLAGAEPFEAEIFAAARTAGQREPYHAYLADALVAMARAASDTRSGCGGGRPRTSVVVLVDHAALIRGHTTAGETCEIAGVGPVPVSTVRAMMADVYLSTVVTDGVDVYSVAHLGRSVTAHQRTALEVRDPECVVPACHVSDHLEIDHIEPWAATKITKLEALARLCRFHHYQKTHEGYRLEGSPGQWRWLAPGETTSPDPPP